MAAWLHWPRWRVSAAAKQDEFLEPDQAFKLAVTARDTQTLVASFTPAESYYLYRDKIKFTLKNAAGTSIAKVELPKGETKSDPNFGDTEVYHHPFQATIQLQGTRRKKSPCRPAYQGCSEKGVCYPPIVKTFELTLPLQGATENTTAAPPNPPPHQTPAPLPGQTARNPPRSPICSKAAISGWWWRASSASACCWRSRHACSP